MPAGTFERQCRPALNKGAMPMRTELALMDLAIDSAAPRCCTVKFKVGRFAMG